MLADARRLLTPRRFDLNAKTVYARQRAKQVQCAWHQVLYLEHLKVWNGFFEAAPRKTRPEDFMRGFDALLDDMAAGRWQPEAAPVPVREGSPYNGAHRVAGAIVHGAPLALTDQLDSGCDHADWTYFRDKTDIVPGGLAPLFSDAMALEYVRNKRNVHTVSLFAADQFDPAPAEALLRRFARIVYAKTVRLGELGRFNYTLGLYENEPWIGNAANGYAGLHFKKQGCFGSSDTVRVLLIEADGLEPLVECKRLIREHYGRGNHSIHINDSWRETWEIASAVFNDNSLHFLNHGRPLAQPRLQALLAAYRAWMSEPGRDVEDFCVVSSAVMAAYGLRDCRDLDFLCHAEQPPAALPPGIGCHNSEIAHYGVHRDEIIYNPMHHFYHRGLKFCTLNVVKAMKWKRREVPKDIADLKLILDFEQGQGS
jgi:hypothetical protein